MKRRKMLSPKDAQRLLRHMAEDPPNPLAKASLERGRDLFKTHHSLPAMPNVGLKEVRIAARILASSSEMSEEASIENIKDLQQTGDVSQIYKARLAVEEKVAKLEKQFKLNESMINYELDQLRREIEILRQIAFIPSAECNRPNETWKERAAALAIQIEQAQQNSKKNIQIEWLADEHDCETCGASWAGGAVVRLNGKEMLDLSPVAACYDESSYSVGQVFCRILELLGYSVSQSGEMDESD